MAEQAPQDKSPAHLVFDRKLVAARRARALPVYAENNFLHDIVAAELSDRLGAVMRDFKLAAEVGARSGAFARTEAGRAIEHLYGIDLVAPLEATAHSGFVVADEERLPLKEGSLDLILAPLSLHVVNDLPGVLTQFRRALKPDGLFMGTLFGGETLKEMRQCLMEAEIETTGGVSPRIAPVVDIRDAGNLLQRAGFALPVADADILTLRYETATHAMMDLSGTGESNVLNERLRHFTRRDTIAKAIEIYEKRFAETDGRVPATYEILYLLGWAPHESQQQPLRPGSAKARLADALGAKEMPAGETPTGMNPKNQ